MSKIWLKLSSHKKLIAIIAISIMIGAAGTAIFYQLQPTHSKTIIVFAGSAATPVYNEAGPLFEAKTGIKVEFRLGGSGSLLSAMQIAKTGDMYIPGSPDYLIKANTAGVVNFTTSQPAVLAYLVLAIIVQEGNPKDINSLEDLAKPGVTIGIGDPASVCVGLYAKELLQANNLWDTVSPNIKTYAQSCEATAALVTTKAVDAVIGWSVFNDWSPDKADIVWIEPSKIPKISYIAGSVSVYAENPAEAQSFLAFLSSDIGDIWAKYGYFNQTTALSHAPNATIEAIG